MDQDSNIEELRGFDQYEVTLGDMIRGERATLGKSLQDIEDELKIRTESLEAIENADISAFPSPSFVAGYVRSYANHLDLDPDKCFELFCAESGFVGLKSQIDGTSKTKKKSVKAVKASPLLDAPIVNTRFSNVPAKAGILSNVSFSGIASLGVLCLLIVGLGYGGMAALKEVQRVQFAPANDAPNVQEGVAVAPVGTIETSAEVKEELAALQDRGLQELYRPTELEVPRLIPRDGPIASIDPKNFGAFAKPKVTTLVAEVTPEPVQQPQVTEVGPPPVDIVALNPAWVRIFRPNGDILFEKILDAGQRYRVPADTADALMRAGNSGSVYVMVGDKMYGPVGKATGVARKVELNPETLPTSYALAEAKFDKPLEQPVNTVAAIDPAQ